MLQPSPPHPFCQSCDEESRPIFLQLKGLVHHEVDLGGLLIHLLAFCRLLFSGTWCSAYRKARVALWHPIAILLLFSHSKTDRLARFMVSIKKERERDREREREERERERERERHIQQTRLEVDKEKN